MEVYIYYIDITHCCFVYAGDIHVKKKIQQISVHTQWDPLGASRDVTRRSLESPGPLLFLIRRSPLQLLAFMIGFEMSYSKSRCSFLCQAYVRLIHFCRRLKPAARRRVDTYIYIYIITYI